MKVIREQNGYSIVRIEKPIFGGYYAILKGGTTIQDGYCLEAAIDVFNNLIKGLSI